MENNKINDIEKEITTIKVHKETREELKRMKEYGKSDAIRVGNILKEFNNMKETLTTGIKESNVEFKMDISRDVDSIMSDINGLVNTVVSEANNYIETETEKRIENALKDFNKQSKIFNRMANELRDGLEAEVAKLNRDLMLKNEYIKELEERNQEKDDIINDYERKIKSYSELNAKYEASQQALRRETYKANDLEIEVKETAKLKIEKAELEAKIAILEEENKKLSIDFTENKALKAELDALKNATQYVNLTIENFIKEKTDLQVQLEDERIEKEELLKQIEELKSNKAVK